MSNFRWPYEVRRAMPDEFGVFAEKDGQNYGPVSEQAIKAGVVTQVVRMPIRAFGFGDNLIIERVDNDGTLFLKATGGVVGSGEFSLDDGTFLNPTNLFAFNDAAF